MNKDKIEVIKQRIKTFESSGAFANAHTYFLEDLKTAIECFEKENEKVKDAELILSETRQILYQVVDQRNKLHTALKRIVIKQPQKVNTNEAADMACEFHIVASEALKALCVSS